MAYFERFGSGRLASHHPVGLRTAAAASLDPSFLGGHAGSLRAALASDGGLPTAWPSITAWLAAQGGRARRVLPPG